MRSEWKCFSVLYSLLNFLRVESTGGGHIVYHRFQANLIIAAGILKIVPEVSGCVNPNYPIGVTAARRIEGSCKYEPIKPCRSDHM